jgi:glycosyltransferase involved in cell wall biosynthesis
MEARQADAVLTLSRHVSDQLRELRRIPYDRISVISHGAFQFLKQEPPTRRFPQGRPFRILFFGRILEYKGLPLLIDAYEQLRRQQPVELHVVGSGDTTDIGGRLRSLPGVHFDNRWIPEGEVGSVLAAADVMVLPYVEASQSGVAAAAFGAGMPVVASPVGGLAEQVRHGENGVIAREISATALAEAIGTLAQNPSLYERCAANAAKTARGELAWPTIAAEIEKVLDRVVAKAGHDGRKRHHAGA